MADAVMLACFSNTRVGKKSTMNFYSLFALNIGFYVFTPTCNVRGWSIHRNDKEHTNAWMNSRIHIRGGRIHCSDFDSAPVPKFSNPDPGPETFRIWKSDFCSDTGYYRSIHSKFIHVFT